MFFWRARMSDVWSPTCKEWEGASEGYHSLPYFFISYSVTFLVPSIVLPWTSNIISAVKPNSALKNMMLMPQLHSVLLQLHSYTHIEPPSGCWSYAAPPGQDATLNSPAFSRSCYAGGGARSSWTLTESRWCGSGPFLRCLCPTREWEVGDL